MWLTREKSTMSGQGFMVAIRLAEYERVLEPLWSDTLQRRMNGFRGTSALGRVASHAARRIDADYILFDTGPNIGPLNRLILLDVDYFIVPAACDLFSLRATLAFTI
jgi:cellulose biosynthesis protein BcsQ